MLHVLFSLKGFSDGEIPVTSTSVFWCSWQYLINLRQRQRKRGAVASHSFCKRSNLGDHCEPAATIAHVTHRISSSGALYRATASHHLAMLARDRINNAPNRKENRDAAARAFSYRAVTCRGIRPRTSPRSFADALFKTRRRFKSKGKSERETSLLLPTIDPAFTGTLHSFTTDNHRFPPSSAWPKKVKHAIVSRALMTRLFSLSLRV